MTPASQDSARHARYLRLRTARHISARFAPSLLDRVALSWQKHQQSSSRGATAALSTSDAIQPSVAQDCCEERVAEDDRGDSRVRSAAGASSDCENIGEAAERSDLQGELRVTVDSVSAFDEKDERIYYQSDGEEVDGDGYVEKNQPAVAESCVVREAWPSGLARVETDGPGAKRRDPEEIAPATVLPLAATATLNDTPDPGCSCVSENSGADEKVGNVKAEARLHPEAAESFGLNGKAPSRQDSKVVAQLVAMYEVFVRCTLQV